MVAKPEPRNSLSHFLVLVILQSRSVLRYRHADYIADPAVDQYAWHFKSGLDLLLAPPWSVLASVR